MTTTIKPNYFLKKVRKNNIHDVENILAANQAPINAVNKNGDNALQISLLKRNKQMTMILLDTGIDINKYNNAGNTPVYEACLNGWDDVVNKLIEYGADINKLSSNKTGMFRHTIMGLYIDCENVEMVKKCLIIDKPVDFNYPYLERACSKNNEEIIKLLIDHKYDVNYERPILNALSNNNGKIVRLLVSKKANIYTSRVSREICFSDNLKMTKLLIELGLDVNEPYKYCEPDTFLCCATFYNSEKIINYLLNNNVCITIGDPLYGSIKSNNVPVTKQLLERGAVLKSLTNKSFITYLITNDNPEMLFVLDYITDPDFLIKCIKDALNGNYVSISDNNCIVEQILQKCGTDDLTELKYKIYNGVVCKKINNELMNRYNRNRKKSAVREIHLNH